MHFIKKLFKKKETPTPYIEISSLGQLIWDEEYEGWIGEFQGSNISLPYDGQSEPLNPIQDFAKNILLDNNFPISLIDKIKTKAKTSYPKSKHQEIGSLEPKMFCFQSETFLLIQFFDEKDNEPFWFAEIHGEEIHVGFDT